MPYPLNAESEFPATDENDNRTGKDLRTLLPFDVSNLSILPEGSWHGIERPLATGYNPPGRGAEGHGTDNTVKVEDWLPNPSGDIAPMGDGPYDEKHPDYDNLVAPTPLYVTQVPDPLKSVTKASTTRIIFDGMTSSAAAAFSGVDPVNIVAIPRDETRTSITFHVQNNPFVAVGSQTLQYIFAICHDSSFPSRNYALAAAGDTITMLGTEPIFIGLFPVAAAVTNQNTLVLQAITETATMVDQNPSK